MKLQSLAAVAALSVSLFAGSAFADGRIAVALESPVAAKTKVVAGGAVFVCDGAECVSTAAPSRALTAVACKALAKEVGRVAAFGELFDHLGAEGREVVGIAGGDQAVVDDDFFVDPVRTGVGEIRL